MKWLNKNVPDLFQSAKKSVINAASKTSEVVTGKSKSIRESTSAWSDRRRLEKNLIERKTLARDYEQNRVPAGHLYYKTIYDGCMADIRQFCAAHNEDVDLTIMQYPFLYSLKTKANPETDEDRNPGILLKAFGAVAAAAVICFLSGAATAMYNGGHQWVNHFFV